MKPRAFSPYPAWAIIFILAAAAAPADSQAREQCTNGGPLTMDQVLASVRGSYIGQALNNERLAAVVTTVQNCHVSFAMDIPALDKLAGARIPVQVLDALNRETTAHLSLEDAHREVAAIEEYLRGGASGGVSDWEPARAKIDTDFEAKAAELRKTIETPKDEFETQAVFTGRVNGAKGQIEPLQAKYDRDIAAYYLPFASRILILGAKTYPIAAQNVWESYDADADLLKVQITGQEYIFSGIIPDLARNYKEHWQSVQTGEKYDDDGTRFLFINATGPRLLGQLPQKIQEQHAAGVWVDAQTGLMWPLRSSSSSFSIYDAAAYCDTLPLAGFSDWRLPLIEELDSLRWGPNHGGVKAGITIATPGAHIVLSGSRSNTPNTVFFKGESGHWYSGEQQVNINGQTVTVTKSINVGFQIPEGTNTAIPDHAGLLDPTPALCVRQFDAGPAPPTVSARFPGLAVPGTAQGLDVVHKAQLEQQAIALRNEKEYGDAFPFAERLCAIGDQVGCALEGSMYVDRVGRTADPARGLELVTNACDQGNPIGCDVLGLAFQRGSVVGADAKKALEIFAKSCSQGDAFVRGYGEGCVHAADAFQKGVGTRVDVQKASAAIDSACDVGRDDFAFACHEGDAEACVNLGRCYLRGSSVNKDADTARMYFQRACSLGDHTECTELAGGPPPTAPTPTLGAPSPQQSSVATQQGDAGQQAQNSPPGPGCDSDIRSNVFNTVPVQIQFINQTDSDRKLFWVDGFGKVSSSGSIKRHTTRTMNGHAGWAWLLTDENKECVLRTATPANGQIIITQ